MNPERAGSDISVVLLLHDKKIRCFSCQIQVVILIIMDQSSKITYQLM